METDRSDGDGGSGDDHSYVSYGTSVADFESLSSSAELDEETPPPTGACPYNRPCAQQYVGKSQSCMDISSRLIPHALVIIHVA